MVEIEVHTVRPGRLLLGSNEPKSTYLVKVFCIECPLLRLLHYKAIA